MTEQIEKRQCTRQGKAAIKLAIKTYKNIYGKLIPSKGRYTRRQNRIKPTATAKGRGGGGNLILIIAVSLRMLCVGRKIPVSLNGKKWVFNIHVGKKLNEYRNNCIHKKYLVFCCRSRGVWTVPGVYIGIMRPLWSMYTPSIVHTSINRQIFNNTVRASRGTNINLLINPILDYKNTNFPQNKTFSFMSTINVSLVE